MTLAASIGRWRIVLAATAATLALFLLLPGAMILVASLSRGEFLEFPPDGVSLRWYRELLADPQWGETFWTSVRIASGAALLATAAGTAAALGVRRVSGRATLLRAIFIAPIALPYVVYALGLYDVFDALRVLGAWWPIMLGQAALAFPVVFVIVDAMLARLDPRITDAAASLGAAWPMVVVRVELPLVLPAVVASGLLAFSFCFDEVIIALFLSGPETVTYPVKLWGAARESASPEVAAASSAVTLLALAMAALFAAVIRRVKV